MNSRLLSEAVVAFGGMKLGLAGLSDSSYHAARNFAGGAMRAFRFVGMDATMMLRLLSILLLLSLLSGCVHRRVTIHSNPPGALAKVDGKVIGYTPAAFDFTWYGEREVELLKDGYETQRQLIKFGAPWYQRGPFEFLSDNLAGKHVQDHREIQIGMQPRRRDSATDVVGRADAFRSEANHGL